MSYDNIKLWFAKCEDGSIKYIDEINDENKHNTYRCPMCNSNLIPKATKSVRVSSHFAHVDVSKCTPESMVHWWFKNKFIEPGDSFTVISDKEVKYICKGLLVEQSYSVGEQIYRPDVTVITECGKTIYFEMNYSNKKDIKDYLDIWIELKNIVVEVDVKNLMARGEIPKFKALFYDGKCFNVKKNDTYYNTIGKYKENKMNKTINDKLKEEMKRLDWFWEEVINYKNGRSSIENISNIIDFIQDRDIKIIISKVLNKNLCVKILEDYFEYKRNYIQSNIDALLIYYRGECVITCKSRVSFNYKGNPYQIFVEILIDGEILSYYYIFPEEIEEKIGIIKKDIESAHKELTDSMPLYNSIRDYIVDHSQLLTIRTRLERHDLGFIREIELLTNNDRSSTLALFNGSSNIMMVKEVIDSALYNIGVLEEKYNEIKNHVIKKYGHACLTYLDYKYKWSMNHPSSSLDYSRQRVEICIDINSCGIHESKTFNIFENTEFIIHEVDKTIEQNIKITKERDLFVEFQYILEDEYSNYGINIYVNEIDINLFELHIGFYDGVCDTMYINTNKVEQSYLYVLSVNKRCDNNPRNSGDSSIIFEDNIINSFLEKLKNYVNEHIDSYLNTPNHLCGDCGEPFSLKKNELKFFVEKGLSYPRRCKQCRIKNKNRGK